MRFQWQPGNSGLGSTIFGGGIGVVPRYDRSVPIQWARLPYTGGVSGPEETVALITPTGAPWGHTPRSVRNYDLGTCGAFVTWAQLATLINGAFFPVYARAIFSRSNSDGTALLVNHADHLLSVVPDGNLPPTQFRRGLDLPQRPEPPRLPLPHHPPRTVSPRPCMPPRHPQQHRPPR